MQRASGIYRDSFGRPVSGATVTVYNAGTQTLATIYQASGDFTSPAGQTNPFSTASDGSWSFAAPNGAYDFNIQSTSTATEYHWNQYFTDIGTGTLANPMTTQGDMIGGSVAGAVARIPANTTATPMYVYGANGALPVFKQIALSEISGVSAGTVTSFNGRVGTVVPVSGDYPASLIPFTQTGTGAVFESADAEFRKRVDVKQFGAVGDGVTDDSTAFQNAINYAAPLGYEIYVPPASYVVNALVPVAGARLVGAGKGASKLIQTTASNMIASTDISNIWIEGLWFHGANSSTTDSNGQPIFIQAATVDVTDIMVRDCKFDNFNGSGCVRLQGNGTNSPPTAATFFIRNAYVLNNEFTGNSSRDITNIGVASHSIYFNFGVTDGVIAMNTVDNTNAKCGVAIQQDIYRVQVYGNTVRNCGIGNAASQGSYGIMSYCLQTIPAAANKDIAIYGNSVYNTNRMGIYIQGNANWLVNGNTVDTCDVHADDTTLVAGGIAISNGNSPHTGSGAVTGNTVSASGAVGIQVANYKTNGVVSVTGNKVMGSPKGIVNRLGSANTQINSNTISTCPYGIIYNNTSYVEIEDGAMTSGSPNLSSSTGIFTSGMVGQSITVNGAGVAGAALTTTVLSFTDSNNVVLNANASTTVTNAVVSANTTDIKEMNQQINGNTIINATTAAISNATTTGFIATLQVIGNTINSAAQGIQASAIQESQINDNILTGITGIGIAAKPHKSTINGNIVMGSGTYGIQISYDGSTASPQITLDQNISLGFSTFSASIASQYTQVVGANVDSTSATHLEVYRSSPPVSNAWRRGDVCWNTLPSVVGSVGWVCTTAGSPGTWTPFGLTTGTGTAVASAFTIAATGTIFHVTGTSPIQTITSPYSGFTGKITLIADGAWSTTTAGNIGTVINAIAGQSYDFVYDGSKWYASSFGSAGAIYSGTPADPTGTTSTSSVMMGLGAAATITPSKTGRVAFTISGQMYNNTNNDGAAVTFKYGTGTAPINGAAAAGTTMGATQQFTAAAANGSSGFSISPIVSGLTLGTPYWFDLALQAITGGTASVKGITISAHEI